jgi:hypothetical protein
MGALLVLAQALPVVSDDDHDRLLKAAFSAEILQDPADQGIRIGDLAVVEAVFLSRISGPEGLGRLIRGVGVIEVDPAEKLLRRVLVEPLKKGLDDLAALTLDGIRLIFLYLAKSKLS